MEKYSEYKKTGIDWLPQIPAHWNLTQLRKYLEMVSEKNHPDAQLLSVTREQGVIVRDIESKEENHNAISEDLSKYKYIRKGQFVVNKMKAWQGSYAVSDYDGIVSPAYFVYNLDHVNNEFFSKAVRSKVYVSFFAQYSKGIRVGQWDLSPIAAKTIPFIEPPLHEQQAIVSFLDEKTEKIDTLIAEKEKQLSLLDELKQSEIASAVTRGLNPDAPLKDSGISWLGQIPEHWECKRIASLFHDGIEANSNFKYKHAFKFNYGTLVFKNEVGPEEEYRDTYVKYSVIKKNDILINGLNLNYDFVSQRVAIASEDGIITSAYLAMRPKESTFSAFFNYLFKTMDNKKMFHSMGKGIRLTLSFDELKKQVIPVPPISEQQAIVEYIETKLSKINTMISEIQSEIDNLKEYKQSLISDVVTGQIKVS